MKFGCTETTPGMARNVAIADEIVSVPGVSLTKVKPVRLICLTLLAMLFSMGVMFCAESVLPNLTRTSLGTTVSGLNELAAEGAGSTIFVVETGRSAWAGRLMASAHSRPSAHFV